MNKKRLAWVLAVVLLLSLLPVGGMAAQKDNKLGYKLFRGWNSSHSQMLQESNSTLLANTVVKVGSTTLSYGNGNATTVQNAKQHGISVTPPAGYYVAEVIIACNDNGGYNCNTAARSNLITFGAKSWDSTTFTITPAEMNQGAAAGKTVWHSGMGEPYWIMVRLAKSPDPVHVDYDAGAMKNEIGASTVLVENGNDFQVTNTSGNATHQALPIKAAYEKVAQNGKTYRFTGWKVEYYVNYNNGVLSNLNTNGGTVQPGANVKLSLHAKLTAQWKEVKTYRVFYDANGGTGTMTDATLYATGDAITVKANEFTYTHKKFVKFTLDAAGTQGIPADFRMGSSNITLYAQWEEEPTYRVFYDANGGAGTMTDEQLYYMGDAIAVKANEFTYTHKKFVKFTLDAAGTQDIPADFRMKEGNITLYAQWEEEPTYRVFYDANGGTGTMTDEQLYYMGDAITVKANEFTYTHKRLDRKSVV